MVGGQVDEVVCVEFQNKIKPRGVEKSKPIMERTLLFVRLGLRYSSWPICPPTGSGVMVVGALLEWDLWSSCLSRFLSSMVFLQRKKRVEPLINYIVSRTSQLHVLPSTIFPSYLVLAAAASPGR